MYIEESSPFQEHREKLNNISTETSRAVAHELLIGTNVDYPHATFYEDLRRIGKKT